jgi:hypothetical protein
MADLTKLYGKPIVWQTDHFIITETVGGSYYLYTLFHDRWLKLIDSNVLRELQELVWAYMDKIRRDLP